jgi:hypothetical protein
VSSAFGATRVVFRSLGARVTAAVEDACINILLPYEFLRSSEAAQILTAHFYNSYSISNLIKYFLRT